jgi:Ser/Thr protein kinase RdoA (MazF antagonist)
VSGAPVAPRRLPHGYTNATSIDAAASSQGRRVIKRYLGPDAEERLSCEVRALHALAGRFPVPRLLDHDTSRIVVGYLVGVPGQEVLEQEPLPVLHEVGRAARRLQEMDVDESVDLPGGGEVLVHGDFGPQNMLFGDDGRLTGVVDWEFAHLGEPIEDLAWAEWIVRTHHSHLTDALPALFRGYGSRPSWSQRHSAMLARCGQMLDFARRWAPEAADLWQQRVLTTEALRE